MFDKLGPLMKLGSAWDDVQKRRRSKVRAALVELVGEAAPATSIGEREKLAEKHADAVLAAATPSLRGLVKKAAEALGDDS